jgi:hypothetical protein
MTFIDFIKRNYTPEQQPILIGLMKKLNVYDEIGLTHTKLRQAANSGNTGRIISQLVFTTSECIVVLKQKVENSSLGKRKTEVEISLLEMFSFMLIEAYPFSGLQPLTYMNLVEDIVKKKQAKYGWDIGRIEKALILSKAAVIERFREDERVQINTTKASHLDWRGDIALDIFLFDLGNCFNGANRLKNTFNLFEVQQTDYKINLPSAQLVPFLCLFHELHQGGIIAVKGNRGLFVFLQTHLQAPAGECYPNRDFRKLRYEAGKNSIKKAQIQHSLHSLLDKYCVS